MLLLSTRISETTAESARLLGCRAEETIDFAIASGGMANSSPRRIELQKKVFPSDSFLRMAKSRKANTRRSLTTAGMLSKNDIMASFS